jgi:hypothetical protein
VCGTDDVITVGWNRVPELEDPYRLEMLQHACSLGSTEAQYRLGKYYLCQDEDPEEEVRSFPSHTRTHSNLSTTHPHALSRTRDQAKALSYFMKVVSSGLDDAGRVKPFMSIQESALVSKALYKVGICHRRGLGTPVDVELAYRYFALAADRYVVSWVCACGVKVKPLEECAMLTHVALAIGDVQRACVSAEHDGERLQRGGRSVPARRGDGL